MSEKRRRSHTMRNRSHAEPIRGWRERGYVVFGWFLIGAVFLGCLAGAALSVPELVRAVSAVSDSARRCTVSAEPCLREHSGWLTTHRERSGRPGTLVSLTAALPPIDDSDEIVIMRVSMTEAPVILPFVDEVVHGLSWEGELVALLLPDGTVVRAADAGWRGVAEDAAFVLALAAVAAILALAMVLGVRARRGTVDRRDPLAVLATRVAHVAATSFVAAIVLRLSLRAGAPLWAAALVFATIAVGGPIVAGLATPTYPANGLFEGAVRSSR